MKSYLPSSLLLLVGHSAQIVVVCLRIIMDGPVTFCPSASVFSALMVKDVEHIITALGCDQRFNG